MKLSKAVYEFVEGIRSKPGSSSTAAIYGSSLHALVVLAHPDSVLSFTHELVERFFLNQRAKGAAQNTVYKHATALRQFSKWGKRRGLWPDDVMDDPQFTFKMADSLPKPFTEEEMDRIMAVPLDGVQRVTRAILRYTALRVTPVCTLRIGDVNLNPIAVDGVTLPGSIRATKNKGSKILVIPITEELHPILAEWIRANPGKGYDPLIRRSNGQQFTRSAVERWARAWGEEAGVSACHPHRFRHTLATELLRRGVRLEVLQRLLGHVSITTTQAYTRLSDAEVIRALKVPLR